MSLYCISVCIAYVDGSICGLSKQSCFHFVLICHLMTKYKFMRYNLHWLFLPIVG